MNEYARLKQSLQVAIQYSTDITQYPSSRQKSYSQHLHVKYIVTLSNQFTLPYM